jgi:hypothetical protein
MHRSSQQSERTGDDIEAVVHDSSEVGISLEEDAR